MSIHDGTISALADVENSAHKGTGRGFMPSGRCAWMLLGVTILVLAAVRFVLPVGAISLTLAPLLGTFLGLVGFVEARRLVQGWRQRGKARLLSGVTDLVAKETFLTDADGQAIQADGISATEFMRDYVADAEARVNRLLDRAAANQSAFDMIRRKGEPLRVKVLALTGGIRLWCVHPVETHADSPDEVAKIKVNAQDVIIEKNKFADDLLGNAGGALSNLSAGTSRVIELTMPQGQCAFYVHVRDIGQNRREISVAALDEHVNLDGSVQFDDLPVPLLKITPEGRVTLSNRAARRLVNRLITGTTHLGDLMEGLGRSITDWLAETASGQGEQPSELLRLRREDTEMFAQVTLTRIIDDGKPSLIAVLNDATELKTLEAQFVQSQKMQAIGQLAGGVAHDFNNLLTAISGHCDLLLLRHDPSDPDYADLVQINENANRAAALVGQLLAFSRKQTLLAQVLDLRDTLSDLTHLLNRLVGEKVQLSLIHDPNLPKIRADRRQLEQVVMNLVVNARDAMPRGGEIRILTEALTLEKPFMRDRATVPAGDYVVVSVQDEGCGIPNGTLQKVFEPFFTTKRTGEGTGLGLSTAYGIIKQTGGFIFADSVVGKGTTFSLYFPSHEEVEPEAGSHQAPAQRLDTPDDRVVLLVEDEAPVRAFATRALQLRGYTVIGAESGEDALNLLQDDALKVDLFVTDVIMPGMDGPSWVSKARETRADAAHVPVIFMSGYAEESFTDKQARVGGSSFLPKPFSLSELTEAVQNRLSEGVNDPVPR